MGCQKEIVNEIAAKIDSLVAKTQTSIEKLKLTFRTSNSSMRRSQESELL
jgi:hypothetical protein